MRKKKIKLIHLIADSGFSGGPIQLLRLIENLDKSYFDSVIIAPTGFLTDRLKKEGFKLLEFNYKKGLFVSRKIRNIIQSEINPRTIIHCHGVQAGYFGRTANKKFRIPLVYTEHNWTKDYKLPQNWRAPIQLRMMKRLSKYTTFTVCVSRAVQEFLLRKKIVNLENSGVIYNGIDFKKVKKRTNLKPVVIGTIASLHKRKGLIFLFEALSKLKKKGENKIILKIVGKGPEEVFLKQHSVDLGTNFDIQWLGVREDLTDFWSNINIYIQPSLDESFGMAVGEAMGYKIPVIATTAGALPEIVGDSGLLVEPGNSENLVRAIENVINNKTIREENVQKAYERASKEFTVKRMVRNYTDLYIAISNI